MIDPTSFPVYFRLHCREPWVAENGFVFSKIREEELEWNGSRSCSNVQDGIVMEVSTPVFCSVYVKELTGLRELFDGESKPLRIGEVHEVFGGS